MFFSSASTDFVMQFSNNFARFLGQKKGQNMEVVQNRPNCKFGKFGGMGIKYRVSIL